MDTNEHEERNKKSFWGNNWQWIVSMVMFVVFAGFMIYNTWPQKHPETRELLNGLKQQIPSVIGENTVEQKTTVKSVPVYDAWGRVVTANETSSTTKKSKLPESYVISKENMDKALTAVAYAARTEAQNEYKNNFSILLTILTIFGIAWPVIIALLQFKFNKDELKKIKKARYTAKAAVANAEKIATTLDNEMKKILELEKEVKQNKAEQADGLGNAYEGLGVLYYDEWERWSKLNGQQSADDHLLNNAVYCDFKAVFFFAKANNKKKCLRSIKRIEGKADKLSKKIFVMYDPNVIADCLGADYSKFEKVYNNVCVGDLS